MTLRHLVKIACLSACFLVPSCAGLEDIQTHRTAWPEIGQSADTVEGIMGRSQSKTVWASGKQVWRYGISSVDTSLVWPSCVVRGHTCVTVFFQQGTVVDILVRR
jgi:hypothetical protein